MKFSALVKDQIQTDRFVIPCRIYGEKGPHVICLNGVQQSMAMWQSFIRRFSSHYKIVLFDFPGQGKGRILSGSPSATLDEEVAILHEVMKISKAKNVFLCSASWGGVVALAFAAKYPKMIKRLALGSLGTKPNKLMAETIQSSTKIDSSNREQIAETLINSFGENLPPAVKRRIATQFMAMTPERLSAFYEHGLLVIAAKNLRDVVNFKEIQTETVLLAGENDTIIDLDDVKYLAAQLPNCRIKIIKNIGHFMHLESDDVLEVCNEVLSQK